MQTFLRAKLDPQRVKTVNTWKSDSTIELLDELLKLYKEQREGRRARLEARALPMQLGCWSRQSYPCTARQLGGAVSRVGLALQQVQSPLNTLL